jgi:CelD/BcsL family acetyltransferase involved in cellulose biosynthesis
MCARPEFPGVVSPGESCPTLVLAGREQEVGAQLAAKKYIGKRDLRRSLAHVESLGRLRFYRCNSLEEARAALPHLFRMHRQRWQEGQESKFKDPAYEALYEDLLAALWPRNGVAVTVMELDQRPIAISFAFPHGRTWTNHTWIHDQDYRRLSPGSLLIQFMIDDAIRSGYGEFDFTRGAEWYKGRFANEVRRNSDLVVYSRLRDYLAYWSVERWTEAKRALARRNPKLHRGLVMTKRILMAPLRRPGASGSAR